MPSPDTQRTVETGRPSGPYLAYEGSRRPLGEVLLARGAVAEGDLAAALQAQSGLEARLGDILVARGTVAPNDVLGALAEQWTARPVDLAAAPPDPRLIDALGAEVCLREGIVPWRRIGGATVIAASRPERVARLEDTLAPIFGPTLTAVAGEAEVTEAILELRGERLMRRAETCVPAAESARSLALTLPRLAAVGVLAAGALGAWLAPRATFAGLFAWALGTLVLTMMLKLAAVIAELVAAHRRAAGGADTDAPTALVRLPVVSVLVPLCREQDVVGRLIERLGRLSYPAELLDICLVVEERDATTRRMLAGAALPPWMRIVTVPEGELETKPRALNYAMDFCRGSIIGVWDAEDAPEPDQLHKVVRRFRERGPEVACLQGILDFYNARTNWLSRCFAVEYATWFRIVLSGISRLGLAIPLGGTTLFFRRPALEALGGWDAHNVTEDADLGIRLARHGYRTELLETVTAEEANCRVWPWIKQRSRWLKGYAMTWAVHTRRPRRLHRELGAWRFWGVQVLFLGTLSQFVLAPLLWSIWLLALGGPHPLSALLSGELLLAVGVLFFAVEVVNIGVGLFATRGPDKRFLMPWVPTLHLYFPLGALASYKALWELLVRPFFWDKTMHGLAGEMEAAPATPSKNAAPRSDDATALAPLDPIA